MAQKIRVNTVLDLDDVQYEISIAPVTKKTRKKIEVAFNKEKDGSQEYIDLENKLSELNSELEITQELLDVTDENGEKKKLILEKRTLLQSIRETTSKMESMGTAVRESISRATEKMFETMFDEMVSGKDAEKLKAYVNDYSFEIAVKKISEVYDEELSGK